MTHPLLWVANEQHTFSYFGYDSNVSQTSYKDAADTNGKHVALGIDNFGAIKLSSTQTQLWFRCRWNLANGNSSSVPILSFVDSATGVAQFAVYKTAGDNSNPATLVFKYLNGSSVETTITTLSRVHVNSTGHMQEFEVFFKQGSSGELKVYYMRRMVASLSGNYTTLAGGFDTVLIRSAITTTTDFDNWGSICLGSSQIPGIKTTVHRPNSAGGDTAWLGGTLPYNDINESTWATNYENANYTNSTGDNRTYNFDDPTVSSGCRFLALVNCLSVMITADATPTGINFRSRQSTTSYDNGAVTLTKGDGVFSVQKIMETDNLGAVWTNTNAASVLMGFSST